MLRSKIALLVFGESRQRQDVYLKRKAVSDRESSRFLAALENVATVVRPVDELRGKNDVKKALSLLEPDLDAVVLYVPVFVSPALVAHTGNLLGRPFALAGNTASDSLSQLAFLAVAGALDQLGLKYHRVLGDAAESRQMEKLSCFLRAAAAKTRLKGETFGCIGGRSLGISPGVSDPAQWERLFNIDVEHIDQLEIYLRAQRQTQEKVDLQMKWLEKMTGSIQYNETKLTKESLELQIRSYLAIKEICSDYELDFIGVKCQPELSNGFCLQCVAVSLCNDPYDAEGPKTPIQCSCEADADGALTMRLLSTLSGGKPSCLNDIASVTGSSITLANCGAMATSFAACSASAEQNLKAVTLVPHNFGKAGGAAVKFTVPPDRIMTFARLLRTPEGYRIGAFTGKTVSKSREGIGDALQVRPLIFADLSIDEDKFLATFGSNHILAVEGNFLNELEAFAAISGISFLNYNSET